MQKLINICMIFLFWNFNEFQQEEQVTRDLNESGQTAKISERTDQIRQVGNVDKFLLDNAFKCLVNLYLIGRTITRWLVAMEPPGLLWQT